MSTFNRYADTPNTIIIEGQEITLNFKRNGDGTATVSWNIPPGFNGCSVENQAYDGILITASTSPADYITTSPKNGEFYAADNSVNSDINVGDRLGDALVVGAFYDDKTTTSLTLSDVDPKTNYYISAYAVDNVRNYHREGVHAYSLPTGSAETPAIDREAFHDIYILDRANLSRPVKESDLTGLDTAKDYKFEISVDNSKYELTIKGINAQSYTDLMADFNSQMKQQEASYQSPNPPNFNKYYYSNFEAKKWNGYLYEPLQTVNITSDPALKPLGYYWYDGQNIKSRETGGWIDTPLIQSSFDPTQTPCGTLWFNGTDTYEWDGDLWVKLKTYIQATNPMFSLTLSCNTYWYDKVNMQLFNWDEDVKKWNEIIAIISSYDPNNVSTGSFWYDETNSVMNKYSAGTWTAMTNIRYEAPNSSGSITNPLPSSYWYDTTNQKFYKRSADNTTWIPVNFILYPTDPTIRESGDIWWNMSPSVDSLYIWDILNNEWKLITNFIQSDIDPSLPPTLPAAAVWYNTTTDEITYIIKNTCSVKNYLNSQFDPHNPPTGVVWKNNDLYYVWDGTEWVSINPLIYKFDPFFVDTSYYWYNPSDNSLKNWNGSSWDVVKYSNTDLTPKNGDLWLQDVTEKLYQWENGTWNIINGIATVDLRYSTTNDETYHGKAFLHFYTRSIGCKASIKVTVDSTHLLSLIVNQSVAYTDPVDGTDGMVSGPTYNQLGVGTDGSPDERRELHSTIRDMLGDPAMAVELTKAQIDTAINLALKTLRKYSNLSYKRSFFFVDMHPNQQIYKLTNKCVGFNKITKINAIYRMRAGFFTKGFAQNDLFGIAALQQLYTIGSFDLVSFHLMASYIEELETLFASRIMFQWVERSRELRIQQRFYANERVLVDAAIERTEQDLLVDRETSLWLTNWAVAECKMMLYNVRGKFQTLPGPAGSTTLNAESLGTQAETEKSNLLEQLDDLSMQDAEDIGLRSYMIIG